MDLQLSRRTPQWVRFIHIDLRNLLANPLAFTLPTLLILIVNLSYLNAVITSLNPRNHLLPIATFLLLSALLSSLLSIPFEIREGYSDRIQIEFGSIGHRIIARIESNAVIGLSLTLVPYLALTVQERFERLTLDFNIRQFALLAVASIYMTTLGTLAGALWRNYLALSLIGAAILILQVANGFSDHSGWALSSLVERQLLLVPDPRLWKPYLLTTFWFIQIGLIVTSPFVSWLNRSRGAMKKEQVRVINESRLNSKVIRSYSGKRFPLVIKQITSISAHMKMIPFTIFLFAVYPIISSEDAFTNLSPQLRIPVVVSMLITSLFSCAISIAAYRLSQEERERDALSFGGMRLYQRITDLSYSLLFTLLGALIFLAYMLTDTSSRREIDSSLFLRPLTLILAAVPIAVFIARKITDLKIDVRFFILFSIVIPVGEMIISGVSPQLSEYLPSSVLASLAGGKGLYVLMYG